MARHILVLASTFPASETDSVPAFVRDQIVAMKATDPSLEFSVLAPYDDRSKPAKFTRREHYDEYRFHYFWPHRAEKLAGQGGIMPSLKANPLNYLLLPFIFLGEFVAVIRLTFKLKPDIIYAHWFTPQAVVAYFASFITRKSYVVTTHASDVDVWSKIPIIGKPVVRLAAKKALKITAVSPRSMAKLERFFKPKTWSQDIQPKTAIIPMGVDLPDANPASPDDLKVKYGLADQKVLFFMGRLAEKKGVKYLLEALSRLGESNVKLVIAGDGPLRQDLEQRVKDLGLTNKVIFTGYLSGEEKSDYLALADIMVLPSIITDDGDAEGLPVVFMEALAAGKVAIATNESGADNIITDGVSGYLLPQKDTELLLAKIQTALSMPADERARMQAAAREVSRQFDWRVVAKDHIEFFDWRD